MIPIRRPAKGSPLLIPEQSEADFQRQVIAYAELNHWRVFHPFNMRHSAAGYPDLTLCRERVLFLELKSVTGKLRPEQEEWRDALIAANQEHHVWNPDMWATIEEVLSR